ncbi:unnamed protein product, partial [Rotaria sordida]
MKTDDP